MDSTNTQKKYYLLVVLLHRNYIAPVASIAKQYVPVRVCCEEEIIEQHKMIISTLKQRAQADFINIDGHSVERMFVLVRIRSTRFVSSRILLL